MFGLLMQLKGLKSVFAPGTEFFTNVSTCFDDGLMLIKMQTVTMKHSCSGLL